MTPETLHGLRRLLPPFAEAGQPFSELQAFANFYGIDFTARLPYVEHRAGYIRSGTHQLAVHHWRQHGASANLLLLHGYFDHTGLFGKLIDWALARCCNVLMFDLPGHGLSSGEPAVIDDFAEYSRAIHDVLASAGPSNLPLWAMAQSTGCAALIDFAGSYAWPMQATVLLSPLVRPSAWLKVRAGLPLLRPFVDSVPRKFADNSTDKAFLDFVRRDPLQSRRIPLRWLAALDRWQRRLQPLDLGVGPALIIQGDADATVDWRYNIGFIQRLLPGSDVRYLRGAGHHLANEAEACRQAYLADVERWLSQRGIPLRPATGRGPD